MTRARDFGWTGSRAFVSTLLAGQLMGCSGASAPDVAVDAGQDATTAAPDSGADSSVYGDRDASLDSAASLDGDRFILDSASDTTTTTDAAAGADGRGSGDDGSLGEASLEQDTSSDVASEGNPEAASDASFDANANLDATGSDAADARFDAPDGDVADAASDAVVASDANPAPDAASDGGSTTYSLVAALGADCLACAQTLPCFDSQNDCESLTGVAAAGPAAGTSTQQLCLDTLSCLTTTRCAATSLADYVCYCGSTPASTCSHGPANGVCQAAEERGLETTVPSVAYASFYSTALGAGMANGIVQCLLDNACDSCFQ